MIGKRLSHYQIVEQVGAGGMGVVYRAHDEQLDRDVAIKVLPSRALSDDTARKRFRKEALSLARLNHPNIATVHEFGSQGDIDFLVIEYIAGITLDAKLARGPLSPAEVIRLGVQLAAGLEAAHCEGIVHRDLKPGNLRLTADGRLKILDFGLAQLMPQASDQGMTVSLTKSQETSGTLPYMSPEQLSGEMADARTDIWSAGAVLYEMATGKRPFPQTVPALLINSILNQPPEVPSKINAAIPTRLDGVILKALAHDRAQRYQSAAQLGADLERPTALHLVTVPVANRKRSLATLFSIAAIVLLLAAGTYFFLHRGKKPLTTINRRRSVAVLGFKNLSANPEKSWLSTAISEMLTTELSQGDELRTIPGESVAQMKASLALPDADSFSQETLTHIRQNLGSDDVVLGSYLPLGNGQLRLDLRLQDTVAGVTLASVSEKGNESEIDTLVSQAGAELRAKLGVGSLSETQTAVVRASLPSNPEAARLYSEGLQRLRMFDALAARESLEKAAQLAPDHAPTHSALAEALNTLGYEDKAKAQAKKALELSPKFSREERLLIEARSHELLEEMPQAVETYRELWEFFPDNVDYGLFLSRTQLAAGNANDAQKTLTDLRKLSASDADAARIDLAEAEVRSSVGDFKSVQSLSDRAAVRGRSVGANLLAAQALQLEGHSWERMGDLQKAAQLANQARELYVSAGDRRGAARCVVTLGDLLYDQGDYAGAKKQFDSALADFREIGARKSARAALERIGNVFYSQGQLREAQQYYEQVLRFDQEINDRFGLASDYGNLANTLDGLGELTQAMTMQKKALLTFNDVGNKRGASDTLNNTGNVLLEIGELDEAKKDFEQAADMMREISYRHGEPLPVSGIGDTLFAQGDLAGARKQYEEALAIAKEVNDADVTAQDTASLASIDLAEKKYADGEALARQSAESYEKSSSWGNAAWAEATLARNLVGEGKLTDAENAAAKAIALSGKSTGQTPRYEAAFADASVKTTTGKTAEARRELEATLTSAHKLGYRLYEYQARLALAEIELQAGSPSASSHLSALEKESRGHGASLIANQAQELLTERNASAR
jgi:serine/threonine protein kinase/tetratricopeptide (TPR) repeat protein